MQIAGREDRRSESSAEWNERPAGQFADVERRARANEEIRGEDDRETRHATALHARLLPQSGS